jgi:pimeloyl-ACP methyl ester carboxylesterase
MPNALLLALTLALSHPDTGFVSRTATVNGLPLHYTMGGHGPAVILLHGYAETSRMWRPILPQLGQTHTVIAPDLPGIGNSGVPKDGLDMKSSAEHIHALVKQLGVEKAEVVGHDIGLMVAYAYAALYPTETTKLVVMDAFLPGVGNWGTVYNDPNLWHFRFHGPTPEKLVAGRERLYFDYYWNEFAADKAHSIPESDRVAYAAAYARPGRMRAGWAYFISFPRTATDFAELARTKLTMPVLTIGGDHSLGEFLGTQMRIVADNVTAVVIPNAGHWIMEENRKATTDALLSFL